MAYTQIPMLPGPPKVTDDESTFDAKAFTWTLALDSWTNSVNLAGQQINDTADTVASNMADAVDGLITQTEGLRDQAAQSEAAAAGSARDANNSARSAGDSRDEAREYRNAAAQSGNIVANVQDGLDGGTDYFTVAGKEAMTLYRNEGGTAEQVLVYPSNRAVQRVADAPDPLLTSLLF